MSKKHPTNTDYYLRTASLDRAAALQTELCGFQVENRLGKSAMPVEHQGRCPFIAKYTPVYGEAALREGWGDRGRAGSEGALFL